MNIVDLAEKINATIYNPNKLTLNLNITKIAPTTSASCDHITFITNSKYMNSLLQSKAQAVLLKDPLPECNKLQLLHPNPQLAMAETANLFHQTTHSFAGQSNLATVHASAIIATEAILYPFCYIDKNAHIASNCVIYPHAYIGPNCKIGNNTIIYPGAVLMADTIVGKHVTIHSGAVLGGDGFGFVPSKEGIKKVPQTGNVVIEDHVEVGPLATIDRATFDTTTIKRGTKLDSQVHIGHNVEIGENSMLCGQVGIAGSVQIGRNFIAAGQAGVGHGLQVGDNITLASKTGITKNTTEPGIYGGMPASNIHDWRKQIVLLRKLPSLLKTIQELKEKVNSLEKKIPIKKV